MKVKAMKMGKRHMIDDFFIIKFLFRIYYRPANLEPVTGYFSLRNSTMPLMPPRVMSSMWKSSRMRRRV